MSNWIYHGKELQDDTIPKGSIGIIYQITHIPTGQKYIGKKQLFMTGYKTTKGVKKKVSKNSNWKEYYSSSPTLIELVEKEGKGNFKREILIFCSTRAQLLYAEEYFIYVTHALLSPEYSNGNLRSKIFRRWFDKTPEFKDLLTSVTFDQQNPQHKQTMNE